MVFRICHRYLVLFAAAIGASMAAVGASTPAPPMCSAPARIAMRPTAARIAMWSATEERAAGRESGWRREQTRADVCRCGLLLSAALLSAARPARADVVADLLLPCRRVACVSSQDDRPAVWDEPWEYDERRAGGVDGVLARLRTALALEPNCEIVEGARAGGRYLRAVIKITNDGSVRDELEFYLTPGDSLVQFRAERSPAGVPDLGANRRRVDRLRQALKLTKLPVLRDRQTVLWFETPLDTFGAAEYDSAPPLGR
ncbi:hypothetical protein T492DRAFT_1103896 [Pavlovales sp. CCMP2436]|nr:hypothetical protein T492DRAFT_1103896 [Pavlovales sp. CCMP2436]